MTQQPTSINVNSKYFVDRVENDIVQLARAVSLEFGVDIEAAKVMARKMVQSKLNQILTDAEKEGIDRVTKQVSEDIKHFGYTAGRILDPKDIYELLKTFDLV